MDSASWHSVSTQFGSLSLVLYFKVALKYLLYRAGSRFLVFGRWQQPCWLWVRLIVAMLELNIGNIIQPPTQVDLHASSALFSAL